MPPILKDIDIRGRYTSKTKKFLYEKLHINSYSFLLGLSIYKAKALKAFFSMLPLGFLPQSIYSNVVEADMCMLHTIQWKTSLKLNTAANEVCITAEGEKEIEIAAYSERERKR